MNRLITEMSKLSTGQWFQILGLPLVFVLIGVLAKRLGRRDGDKSPDINDWAVCTSVLLMTFGKVLADVADPKAQAITAETTGSPISFWWLIGILLASFLSIEHDRFRSWTKDTNGQAGDTGGEAPKRKRLFIGVIFPDLVSVIVFASYQLGKAISL